MSERITPLHDHGPRVQDRGRSVPELLRQDWTDGLSPVARKLSRASTHQVSDGPRAPFAWRPTTRSAKRSKYVRQRHSNPWARRLREGAMEVTCSVQDTKIVGPCAA